MSAHLRSLVMAIATVAMGGCDYPVRNQPIASSAPPPYAWRNLAADQQSDTLIIVTASGGGTRATALTMSVLDAMDDIKLPSGRSMAEEVDVISSVSGGSVTAAFFAAYGVPGFKPREPQGRPRREGESPNLEDDFVRQSGMRDLISAGLNPVSIALGSTRAYERIDLFINYLDRQLFGEARFDVLKGRRPYLVMNATDMVEGMGFPFTQTMLDNLCSELTNMKISTAVAASAAFPVALSPVTLKNYCPKAKALPPRITDALDMDYHVHPARVTWGRIEAAYAKGEKEYVHLLDGGLADNLGVGEPLNLLIRDEASPNFRRDIGAGRIKHLVFVMVNARSDRQSELDHERATPTAFQMASASIGTPIDRASFANTERVRTLFEAGFIGLAAESRRLGDFKEAANFRAIIDNSSLISVDFDAIRDGHCRQQFQGIPTSWSLSTKQIDALKAVGGSLLAAHPMFNHMKSKLKARQLAAFQPIEKVCAEFLK
jgi:NTE family protein